MIRRLVLLLVSVAVLALPEIAAAAPPSSQSTQAPGSPSVTVKIRVGHLRGDKAPIFSTVPVIGSIAPFAPGQKVDVTFYLNSHKLLNRIVGVRKGGGDVGLFRSSIVLRQVGKYAVSASHAATPSLGAATTLRKSWKVSFPSLRVGQCSPVVGGFKSAMARMGYASGGGSCFNGRTSREVLAYRKVNGMARTGQADSRLVEAVYGGRGGYRVRYPGAGVHAEVPLSKQVLVLTKGDRPFAIYPVSTGKPSTPTITGHYRFYLRSPGYNSEGMYYAFYWHNGYAVHGYASVPNYPASHGCVRTYISDQPRIYYQLSYGESIFVF